MIIFHVIEIKIKKIKYSKYFCSTGTREEENFHEVETLDEREEEMANASEKNGGKRSETIS